MRISDVLRVKGTQVVTVTPDTTVRRLLAVLAGAEAFTDIARFGEKKLDLLRRFRPFAKGAPSHDHLGDIFATLDARAFQNAKSYFLFILVIAEPGQYLKRAMRPRR